MVVLVHLVVTLLGNDVLGGVVLVVRVYVPTLDAGHDVAAIAEVPLALEVAVLQKVLLDIAVPDTPLGLQGKVGKAEGVDGNAVTVYEHALVGSNGIAVRVVKPVGIVERASVARIADAFLTDEGVGTVIHTQRAAADIALEADTVSRQGIGEDHRTCG